MENIGPKSLLLFLEIEDCVGKPSCGGSQLHFAIYNAFYAPLLCKGGMMKRISSLRNEIPAAPPTPSGYTCCWRCSTAHWRKIPSTPILVSWRTWPFYIPCALFYAVKGWEGRWWGGGGGSEQSKLYSDPFSFPVNSKNLTYVSESVNYWLCILSKPSATWWKMLIIQIVPCLQYQCTFPDLAHFEHI